MLSDHNEKIPRNKLLKMTQEEIENLNTLIS